MLIVSCPSYPCHFASLHLTSTAPQPHHIPHLTWTSHPSLHRFAPQSLDSPGFQSIATLIIILLSKKNYTRNPYLIAKLVEVHSAFSCHSSLTFLSFTLPPISLVSVHPTSYFQPFTSPHLPCTHPSPHLLSYTQYSSLAHTSQPFSSQPLILCHPVPSPLSSPVPSTGPFCHDPWHSEENALSV